LKKDKSCVFRPQSLTFLIVSGSSSRDFHDPFNTVTEDDVDYYAVCTPVPLAKTTSIISLSELRRNAEKFLYTNSWVKKKSSNHFVLVALSCSPGCGRNVGSGFAFGGMNVALAFLRGAGLVRATFFVPGL
jgi:hypothetical protein